MTGRRGLRCRLTGAEGQADHEKRNLALPLIGVVLGGLVLAVPVAAITWGTPDAGAHQYVGPVVFRDGAGAPTARCGGSLLTARIFLTSGHCAVLPGGAAAPVAEVWLHEHVTPNSASVVGVSSISPDGAVAAVRLDSDAPVARYAELPAVGVVDTLANKTALTARTC